MERALIFGSNGQDGYYLNNLLKKHSVEVIGISRKNADIVGEVQNGRLVADLVKQYAPSYIFHFAANSTTSHNALWENHEAICIGTLNILEAVRQFSPSTKVFLSGSGLQFENYGKPIDETFPFAHSSPYVVSRNHSVFAARYYRDLGHNVYVGYFFNHDSPHRPRRHMAQKIASFCRDIEHQTEKLTIGDLDAKKEWTFAGDVVNAIWILVNQENIFECVIGSGKAYPIVSWLELCFSSVGKNWKDYVVENNQFRSEYDILVSNPSTILSMGWNQEVGLQHLSKLMLKNA